MKNKVTFIFISVLTSIILFDCSTTSPMYLQSARATDDNTYGYTISNPIMLKCSKSFGNKKIIDEYISRLSSKEGSFTIIQKEIIPITNVDSIECYKIISEKGKESYSLYFKFVKNKRKFYVPNGLFFSYLSD